MTAPVLDPTVQYNPSDFAHGSVPDMSSRIPRICGYICPVGDGFTNIVTPGYFGPQQQRPSVGSDAATWPAPVPGEYPIAPAIPGTGTDSTNQGQPSVGTTLPFGSLVFWANNPADPAANGFAVRIDPDGSGYGEKPGEKLVTFTGGIF